MSQRLNKDPKWLAWEKEVAERFEASLVAGSGRHMGYKGDVKSDEFLIDCKYTDSDKYILSAETWRTLSLWAINEKRTPLLVVKIGKGGYEFVVFENEEPMSVKCAKSKTLTKKNEDEVFRMGNKFWSSTLRLMPLGKFLKGVLDED